MEQKVAVIDRVGDVIRGVCTMPNTEPIITISNGELTVLDSVDRINVPRPRENCPRAKGYNTEQRIGCIGCMHALIDYGDVLVWPITPVNPKGYTYND